MANAAPEDTLMVIDAERQSLIATLQVKDGNIIPASGMLDEPRSLLRQIELRTRKP